MSRGPSPHLTWHELGCKDGTPYPKEWRDDRAALLAEVFEVIRAAAGRKPLSVLSAYRTPSHNRKVGGASNSQHLHGRALDLLPPKGMTAREFFYVVRAIAYTGYEGVIGGIGLYRTFVHVDTRDSASPVIWNQSGTPL